MAEEISPRVSRPFRAIGRAQGDARPIRTLESDSPWPFDGQTRRGGAGRHYATLGMDGIRRFPLVPLAKDVRHFMWRVGAMQEEALSVMDAWGFTLKSEIIWIKTTLEGLPLLLDEDGDVDLTAKHKLGVKRMNNLHYGMGFQTHYAHEVCLIGTRGNPERTGHIRSVFFAPIPRHKDGPKKGKIIHSRKPDKFYRLVEAMSPGPYHSMFSRLNRPGWTCEGDELDEGSAGPLPAEAS